MRPQEEEIKKSGEQYGKLAESFKSDVADSNPDDSRRVDTLTRSRRNANVLVSKVPQLYGLLKKNADSFVTYTKNFFAIPINRDKRIQFPNAPQTYTMLSKHHNSLMTLVNADLSSVDKNGNPVFSCLNSRDAGQTEHDYIKRMHSLKGFKAQDIEKLGHCESPNCYDCIDCHRHQDELYKALAGIWDDGDQAGHQRGLHIKNLVSTLNSWASHMDSRGMDAGSADELGYRKCAEKHQLLATSMRNIAREVADAYEADGVGVHEDPIYGDEKGPGH